MHRVMFYALARCVNFPRPRGRGDGFQRTMTPGMTAGQSTPV
jgi:hypothetical protein